jgi:hypothetical protein
VRCAGVAVGLLFAGMIEKMVVWWDMSGAPLMVYLDIYFYFILLCYDIFGDILGDI